MAFASKKIGFIGGLGAFVSLYYFPITIITPESDKVIAVAAWMIIWWISETVSISVTAFIPLTIFPMLQIMPLKEVASYYSSPIIYLFFGGFVIALALEKVQLHRRIALSILKLTGTHADGIILGFMLATALMSMWISNTASTVLMLPIALSVVQLVIQDQTSAKHRYFTLSIMLGIAYAANIGGMATPIGTPPNSVTVGLMQSTYNIDIGFFEWSVIGFPYMLIMLAITYLLITKVVYPNRLGHLEFSSAVIQAELDKLGKMQRAEKVVLVIFGLTALLWILRSQLNLWFPSLGLSDTTISMLAALAMFTVPYYWQRTRFILKWEDTKNLPWGIVVLFGGGLALAAGFARSGLLEIIKVFIESQSNWSIFIVGSVLMALMLFMTELIGNVALVTILIPAVASIAIGLGVPVLQLVIPVTLASSCAFMLPMATPPNAIVFASGHIKVYQMLRVGIFLNLIALLGLMVLFYFV